MPKTPAKAKKGTKPVSKKTVAAVKSAPKKVTAKSATWWDTYCAERDAFYKKHRNSQWLMAILIIVILIYIGAYFWSQSVAWAI